MRFAKDYRSITAVQLDEIIAAGGGLQGKTSEELKDALETEVLAGQIHAAKRRWRKPVTIKADDFGKVERAAKRLLQLLDVADDGKPHAVPKIRVGLEHRGFDWARRWFNAAEREKRAATIARARERRLIAEGKTSEAAAARENREHRRGIRARQWERWHQLHGNWPSETSPKWVQTPEGERYLIYGEGLALVAAVEGLQRLRTWAELEAQRLSKSPAQVVQFEPSDGPLRETRTVVVCRLADLYPRFFGRKFGVSKLAGRTKGGKPAGSVGGPGVRFVQAFLRGVLDITMSPEAIEKAWDTSRASSKRNMGNRTHK